MVTGIGRMGLGRMRPVGLLLGVLVAACCTGPALAGDATRVLPAGQFPPDARLKPQRTYNDAYHPWSVPANKAAWELTRDRLRTQLLTSVGLWPMPPKAPLKPVIHSPMDRGDYTIEKVYFESFPGHYVSGNLYRPKGVEGKRVGILYPHGHWLNGRFYDATEADRKKDLKDGAEQFEPGAHSPPQACMAHLARMGCVAFHYDMVGYADSQSMPHRTGFGDVTALLHLQGLMGVQTFNSICALDFLMSLPDVDVTRIGVTGSSGGGTQTFVLGAIDPRPAAAFPAVMVGTAMQGGCVCENAPFLRLGLNNVAYASMFAPKPLAMSAANDWTIDIETKGLPEMKTIWGFYGAADKVYAETWPEFGHNYNQVAREMMYAWFNEHLKVGRDDLLKEREFPLLTPAELTVFDAEHPRPKNELSLEQFKEQWRTQAQEAFASKLPKDAAGLVAYRDFLLPAATVILSDLPRLEDVLPTQLVKEEEFSAGKLFKTLVTRAGSGDQVPVTTLASAGFNGEVVVWIEPEGKSQLLSASGEPAPHVKRLLDAGYGVAGVDLFLTGEFVSGPQFRSTQRVDEGFPGYTYGYNRSLLAERVRDLLTAITAIKRHPSVTGVHLIGRGEGGVWTLLARGLAGDRVGRCVVDVGGFGFSKLTAVGDPNMLPGALRYGGLGGLAALSAPAPLVVSGTAAVPAAELAPLKDVYQAVGAKLTLEERTLSANQLAERFLQP
jgi:hypothetical protein